MFPLKSGWRGAMPQRAGTRQAPGPRLLPWVIASALLVSAQTIWAQQDNSTVSEPKETVVVTGVYEPVPLGEVDRPVTQLPDGLSDELVANSLEDFLRLDSSIDLQERGPNGTQADVAMRGGTFEQTLILVDGFRMNDLQTGHHDMDLPFPVDSFSEVEVLHGAGFHALRLRCRGRDHQFHHPPATGHGASRAQRASATSESIRKAPRGVW